MDKRRTKVWSKRESVDKNQDEVWEDLEGRELGVEAQVGWKELGGEVITYKLWSRGGRGSWSRGLEVGHWNLGLGRLGVEVMEERNLE